MNIKDFLRKKIPKDTYEFLYKLKNTNFRPFSLASELFPSNQYSDFFIYSDYCEGISFIAENANALLYGDVLKVIHLFNFYDSKGKYFHSFKYETNEYHTEIKLPKLDLSDSYCSFTHNIIPKNKISQKLNLKLQHRGYTIYKNKGQYIGSLLHGNFGAIENKYLYRTAARKRALLFEFTPVYEFDCRNLYHLIFNNPTKKQLKIKIRKNNILGESIIENIIPSFGCKAINVNNYSGSLTFISNLPVCRATIFKNPTKKDNFDVFHS